MDSGRLYIDGSWVSGTGEHFRPPTRLPARPSGKATPLKPRRCGGGSRGPLRLPRVVCRSHDCRPNRNC